MESRQNFDIDCEHSINVQINNELFASYTYLAMANYFRRTNVALYGAGAFFHNQHLDELTHAYKLIEYMTDRGGVVKLAQLSAPQNQEWASLLAAFKDAVDLERNNNTSLMRLHEIASNKQDSDVSYLPN
ncbi:unnamed protein product [Bursaphelenchus okinawaensis]|uniref:Ferritin n=1 Tax=Bursaphelenchus okinawaensis TaxID=465554 RepID=A0A811JSZ0_9BILA|nr:unnamed protein product [Bursaphelenchus okinawaensis]CAG9082286.1 unnamed protein product [Bursaphelenchus okinawaensis]